MKFSVITVCLNAEKSIETTIQSVLSQTYPHVEYIIVDGKSTDATLAIVDKHASQIAKVVSEKDKGIYDAMNKGVDLATGDVIYFLNADDYLYDSTVLADVAKVFQSQPSGNIVYGRVRLKEAPMESEHFADQNHKINCLDDFLHHTICHQAVFARSELFGKIGKFNSGYKYAADYDWLIRSYKHSPKGFHFHNRYVATYFYLGRSHKNASLIQAEYAQIRLKQLFSLGRSWFLFRYVILRGLKKQILNEAW